jgi:hypothetical protein
MISFIGTNFAVLAIIAVSASAMVLVLASAVTWINIDHH